MKFEALNLTSLLLWLVFLLVLFLVLRYNWRRRWLYYYGSQLSGPSGWPLVGIVNQFFRCDNIFRTMMEILYTNESIFKAWFFTDLFILNTIPKDVEVLLNAHLDRLHYVKHAKRTIGEGLIVHRANVWKGRRKMINPAFGTDVLRSFLPIFVKYSNQLVEDLNRNYRHEQIDLLKKLFMCTLSSACESFGDVDAERLEGRDTFIAELIGSNEIRMNIFFPSSFSWKYLQTIYKPIKETRLIFAGLLDFTKQLVLRQAETVPEHSDHQVSDLDSRNKRVLNLLNGHKQNGAITDRQILGEMENLIIAATETTAYTLNHVLTVLGIYPDIQSRVQEEIDFILGDGEEITWDHYTQMDYTERVIKETMRLFPTVPGLARQVKKDFHLNSIVYPKGCIVGVPLMWLHRKPELWEEPEKFNPDRFLPEEKQKRPRCSYIPFSYGLRNCIGFKYAMMSMKIVVATILRHYTITSVDYKSIEEIEVIFGVVIRLKNGCRVVLQARKDRGQ